MNIVFSRHANLKIAQRRLSRQKILNTVARPDTIRPGHSGREIALKKFGVKYLHVVIIRERNTVIVVTAHWVARRSKS
jgi:hypothetical protein